MKFVPNALSRVAHRSILKLNGASPTILVVVGVGGLITTAVLASKASRKIDPIIEDYAAARDSLNANAREKDRGRLLGKLYIDTAVELGKLYAPTIVVGVASTTAVLGGHKILRGRHVATMAAYSGLLEQFQSYRKRVATTLGENVEKGIYEGAHGEWTEDPDNKGEHTLKPVFSEDDTKSFLRPFFDETNPNWTRNPQANYYFLKGVQNHMNNILAIRGHVFLNEVYDALGMPRCREGAVSGWLYEGRGDCYVDFGFMTSIEPNTVAFRNHEESRVRLNFNIDGTIWDQI